MSRFTFLLLNFIRVSLMFAIIFLWVRNIFPVGYNGEQKTLCVSTPSSPCFRARRLIKFAIIIIIVPPSVHSSPSWSIHIHCEMSLPASPNAFLLGRKWRLLFVSPPSPAAPSSRGSCSLLHCIQQYKVLVPCCVFCTLYIVVCIIQAARVHRYTYWYSRDSMSEMLPYRFCRGRGFLAFPSGGPCA